MHLPLPPSPEVEVTFESDEDVDAAEVEEVAVEADSREAAAFAEVGEEAAFAISSPALFASTKDIDSFFSWLFEFAASAFLFLIIPLMEVLPLDTFADGVFGDGVPFCRASDLTSASPFSSSFSEALEQKGKGLELSKGR